VESTAKPLRPHSLPQKECKDRQQYRRNPNPQKFALQNGETTGTKEATYSDWRHTNRSPRKEVTMVVEGRDSATPRPPSVMASSNPWLAVARKKYSHSIGAAFRSLRAEPEHDDDERQKGSEKKRMSEPSVPPKVAVPDSAAKPNHIKVRYNGTHRSNHPNAFWNLRRVETGSDSKGYHCEGRKRWHLTIPLVARIHPTLQTASIRCQTAEILRNPVQIRQVSLLRSLIVTADVIAVRPPKKPEIRFDAWCKPGPRHQFCFFFAIPAASFLAD
jgi:hypothetical protein